MTLSITTSNVKCHDYADFCFYIVILSIVMLNVVMQSVVAPCLEYDSGIFKSFSKLGFEPGLFRFLINVLTPLSHLATPINFFDNHIYRAIAIKLFLLS